MCTCGPKVDWMVFITACSKSSITVVGSTLNLSWVHWSWIAVNNSSYVSWCLLGRKAYMEVTADSPTGTRIAHSCVNSNGATSKVPSINQESELANRRSPRWVPNTNILSEESAQLSYTRKESPSTVVVHLPSSVSPLSDAGSFGMCLEHSCGSKRLIVYSLPRSVRMLTGVSVVWSDISCVTVPRDPAACSLSEAWSSFMITIAWSCNSWLCGVKLVTAVI